MKEKSQINLLLAHIDDDDDDDKKWLSGIFDLEEN